MSQSSKPTSSTTNPSTPLSPFPSTPHRLSYIQNQNPNYDYNNNDPNSSLDSPIRPFDQAILTEHISPTKAAQETRLNHEINTITTWLEGLFSPSSSSANPTSFSSSYPTDQIGDPSIPPHFMKWKFEVLSAALQGSFDGPVSFPQHPSTISSTSSSGVLSPSTQPSIFDNPLTQSPSRPTQQSRTTSATSTNTTTQNPVLEHLKTLKQVNLSADYLASLLHDARLEELRSLQTRQTIADRLRDESDRARILLDGIYRILTPDAVDALRSLAEAAVTLGVDLNHDLAETATGSGGVTVKDLTVLFVGRIWDEVRKSFMLEDEVKELKDLGTRIRMDSDKIDIRSEGGQEDTDNVQGDVDGDGDRKTEQIHVQTAQFNRDTKQINLKIMEYHDRVVSLERQLASLRSQSASLQDVLDARARVEDRRARVKALQERFAAFNGLPPDLEDSRNEVRRAMAELESLKKHREGLFERMGTG